MKNPVLILRKIAIAEAISFLVLLGLAMPLKYIWGIPIAVKVVGWIHGFLFVLFCASLLQTTIAAKWPIGRAALVFIAALLPFGPIVLDSRMVAYQDEYGKRLQPK